MTTLKLPKWLTALGLTLLTIVGILHACQVPVFRYALERWESDKYQLFLVTPRTLTEQERAEVDSFKKTLPDTNLTFTEINVSTISEADLWKLPEINTSISSPQLFLFHPEKLNQTTPIANLPLSAHSLNTIIDSPARNSIVKSLVAGDSAVWVILHNNDEEKAAEVQKALDLHIGKAANSIQLPEGIVGTNERDQITDQTDLEDVLRSSIPLKIAFSSKTLDSNAAGEEVFVATLLENLPASIRELSEPLIIPVFGRGRKITPILASELSYTTILSGSQYLCGACSCQVKEQNPGVDLLIHENWPAHLTDGLAVVEKELPPLTGAAEVTPQDETLPVASEEKTHNIETSSNYTFLAITAVLLSLLAAATFVILRKQ